MFRFTNKYLEEAKKEAEKILAHAPKQIITSAPGRTLKEKKQNLAHKLVLSLEITNVFGLKANKQLTKHYDKIFQKISKETSKDELLISNVANILSNLTMSACDYLHSKLSNQIKDEQFISIVLNLVQRLLISRQNNEPNGLLSMDKVQHIHKDVDDQNANKHQGYIG